MKNTKIGRLESALSRWGGNALLLAAGIALYPLSASATDQADITKMCGNKDIRVALVDGVGGDNWRKTTRLEFAEEVAKCPNIKETLYFDAAGDPQKYNQAIGNYVSQGVDAIVAFAEFGESSLPTYREAINAGSVLVAYMIKVDGTEGQDFSANVYQDLDGVGREWAKWLGKNVKSGGVVYLGGPPGVVPSTRFINGLKAGLQDYPDLQMLDPNYIVTNWNPADAQKAVTGLIAKYPKIDAVVTDYGVTALAAIKTFEQAGLPIPAIATVSTSNELNCKYLADKKAGKEWRYFTMDNTTRMVRFALRRAVSLVEGTENPDPISVLPPVYVDSFTGLEPRCDPDFPPDADLSSELPVEKLKSLFN